MKEEEKQRIKHNQILVLIGVITGFTFGIILTILWLKMWGVL